MNRIGQIWRVMTHPAELRLALSGLGMRLGGDEAMGGLTDEETAGLIRWVNAAKKAAEAEAGGQGREFVVVEVGTLFGLTAKAIARETGAQVTAVDIFCWNPFGLTSAQHEAFTRRILESELKDGSVTLVDQDAQQFLREMKGADFVFLDGDHRYEAVKAELEILKAKGVKWIAGHDFGNPNFGVTQAVREVVGEADETAGMCWLKRMNGDD